MTVGLTCRICVGTTLLIVDGTPHELSPGAVVMLIEVILEGVPPVLRC